MKSRFLEAVSTFRAALQTAIEPPRGAPVYPARQGAFLAGIALLVWIGLNPQPVLDLVQPVFQAAGVLP